MNYPNFYDFWIQVNLPFFTFKFKLVRTLGLLFLKNLDTWEIKCTPQVIRNESLLTIYRTFWIPKTIQESIVMFTERPRIFNCFFHFWNEININDSKPYNITLNEFEKNANNFIFQIFIFFLLFGIYIFVSSWHGMVHYPNQIIWFNHLSSFKYFRF